jgi:transposase-like protein
MRGYKPVSCPKCSSQNVEQTNVRIVQGKLEREFTCHHCRNTWSKP